MDEYPYPIGYGVSLCPAEAEPAFESAEQQELGWGREWGAHDEVGVLRRVLVRSPGNEFERVRAAAGTSAPRRWSTPTAAGTGSRGIRPTSS